MTALVNGWLLPVIYGIAFALALLPWRRQWLPARGAALLGLLTSVAAVVAAVALAQFQPVSIDKPGLVVALLVALLGWVIINYSRRYLQGEPNQALFVRAMLFTLACVSLLVVSRHLLVIVLAWTGTSIGLHYLLTFYPDRKAAQIVAHKKFIASRLADTCLLAALVLIYQATGTLTLDGIAAFVKGLDSLPAGLHWATALFALAAILKSAQLPLHGWLIQVMEAPTPVSALLHAGVVNIGGFVLIRLADLVTLAPVAQAMLVIAGGLTAVLAGLVMMTRISIKVRLAWSTCTQMGFMLMEVGLGLYELALLHLVAHSFYKAYAFLAAGETVAEARSRDFFNKPQSHPPVVWYLASFALSGAVIAACLLAWQLLLPAMQLPLAAAVIVALGLAPLLWMEQGMSATQLAIGLLRVFGITQLYFVWHLLFAGLAPPATETSSALLAWVIVIFCFLYVAQIWLLLKPQSQLTRALFPWAYYGFYLDESFTRFTFRFWPAKLSPEQAQTRVNR